MPIQIASSAFEHNGKIPKKFTCDGDDVSPALEWSGAPMSTVTYMLIAEDPDAPMGTWVHWVLYDLPAHVTMLPEDVPAVEHIDQGGTHGINDFRHVGYGGPCPPGGTHRYYFKIYALDTRLDLGSGAAKKEVLDAAKGHIIDQGELMGKYSRG